MPSVRYGTFQENDENANCLNSGELISATNDEVSNFIETELFRKAENRIRDPAKLKRLITLIDGEVWMGLPIDVKGEIYEGLLQKKAEDITSGA